MPTRAKGTDKVLKEIRTALDRYKAAHPKAEIESYRQNSVSVRVRVISPEFQKMTRSDREEEVWAVLNELAEETAAEVSMLLLLTPDEAKKSLANREFDDPIPSKLF
jgi:stress-induced morphogen